jgi:6-phosphogluconolactonase/glucosamine-6-phosphate isomerase/deaminase
VELVVSDDPAAAAASWLARRLTEAVHRRGVGRIAVSGGATAPAVLSALGDLPIPWADVVVWQVDERIAPDGDPNRNAVQLADLPARLQLMPVTATDLREAADEYEASLPDRFDVVHLGLGDDGHTASWPPGDKRVLKSDRRVEITDEFRGFRRMTLTPLVVNGARARMVIATGTGKAPAVRQWLLRDRTIPVDAVRRKGTKAFFDAAAASELPAESATGGTSARR